MLFFKDLAIVPKQGDMKGNQYLMMTRSGFILLIRFPVSTQFKGLIELIILITLGSLGSESSEN